MTSSLFLKGEHLSSYRNLKFGSGTVLTLGIAVVTAVLAWSGWIVGWDATWRAFGVTPLQPPFFDMHIINDYTACAAKGADAYAPASCNPTNFNIPPTWLWMGDLGIDGADSTWLAGILITAAAIVAVRLICGRPWPYGLIAIGAVLSPSVLMGVERGNLDLLILALVGLAAMTYNERSTIRTCSSFALLSLAIALKLIPMFCVVIAIRFSKRSFVFACMIASFALVYLTLMLDYIFLIRRNVPTTFILSYGYKTIFLGIDHVRSEAGLGSSGLAETWVPVVAVILALTFSTITATKASQSRRNYLRVDKSVAGTAFLFGAGIYCGTFLLGTNFIYRLMFLLLCVPQLLDWQIAKRGCRQGNIAESGLLIIVIGVLWINGNSQGHSVFLLLPQIVNWILFYAFTTLLICNGLCMIARPPHQLA